MKKYIFDSLKEGRKLIEGIESNVFHEDYGTNLTMFKAPDGKVVIVIGVTIEEDNAFENNGYEIIEKRCCGFKLIPNGNGYEVQ